MPVIKCPGAGCTYETPDVDAAVIAQLLNLHKVAHPAPAPQSGGLQAGASREAKQRVPKIQPPKISEGSSEETWNSWHTRWIMFKRGTILSEDEKVQQLFQCCDQSLGDAVLPLKEMKMVCLLSSRSYQSLQSLVLSDAMISSTSNRIMEKRHVHSLLESVGRLQPVGISRNVVQPPAMLRRTLLK